MTSYDNSMMALGRMQDKIDEVCGQNRALERERDVLLAELSSARAALEGYKWVEWVYEGEPLTVEKIGAELADLHAIAPEVSLVYEHVTRGFASKATTLAREIIALHDDAVSAEIREAVEEETEHLRAEIASLTEEAEQSMIEIGILRRDVETLQAQIERQAPLVEAAREFVACEGVETKTYVDARWSLQEAARTFAKGERG